MNATLHHRPEWQIDCVLEKLLGQPVRVAAIAFAPPRWDGAKFWMPARKLILPDNSEAAGLPVYFEGRLESFERHIGVVSVELADPLCAEQSTEGIVSFRGQTAVIVRGPATVKLACPFCVEKLPAAEHNYWTDLQVARAQLQLPL